ncbi:hypothetical protein V6N12_034970 [Hibiscus sabdariffa]|uniref:Uncharacterized protein n=1 Tax=Hibiscus sabdariffa TaxID=183260 RepID=A0ABR2BPF2_9ROSI
MDLLPSDTESVVQPVARKSYNRRVELSGREKMSRALTYITQGKWELTLVTVEKTMMLIDGTMTLISKSLDFVNILRKKNCKDLRKNLRHEKFNKGRKALYAGLGNVQTMHEKPLGSKRFAAKEKDLHHQMYKSELFTAKQNESRRRSMNKDFRLHSMIDYNEKLDVAPTRIVILRLSLD